MGYCKSISSGLNFELYEYEENIRNYGRKKSLFKGTARLSGLDFGGQNSVEQIQQTKSKRRDNTKRAVMAFRRIVLANLGISDVPLFVTLTYAEAFITIGPAHQDYLIIENNDKDPYPTSLS